MSAKPFQTNPFTVTPGSFNLIPAPGVPVTHEPRTTLRSYLSRPDGPVQALVEALSGPPQRRRPAPEGPKPAKKTPEPDVVNDQDEPEDTAGMPSWGR